jgi:PAS domain S-box-containing protein
VFQQQGLQRSVYLAPEPRVVSAARKFVRSTLSDAGRDAWSDTAELAVSELVTNSVLHAGTAIEVAIEVSSSAVLVAVHDHSFVLPTQRHWGETATTGRGLALVRSITSQAGVDLLASGGKRVWFRLEDIAAGDSGPASAGSAEFSDLGIDAILDQFEDDAAVAKVDLVELPVLLWLAAQEHHEAVLRELFLLTVSGRSEVAALDLSRANRASAALSTAVAEAVLNASARGVEVVRLPEGHPSPLPQVPARVDASLRVALDDHDDFSALQDALDVGLRLGEATELLIRPALPEMVALRDWACEQVLAQVNGVPSAPWPGTDHPRFDANASPAPCWDDALVRTSPRLAIAADDSNRLIALSPAATEFLGWAADELLGRRVVTIVPPQLREAHVAGFTRHLTTGQAHALGVEVDLPVLRRDGSEKLCRFLIDQVAADGGRSVYVAWLTVLEDEPERLPPDR